MNTPVLESMLTCPHCGFIKRETMPRDACQFYYECANCKALLRPNPGDCCVFCSFGSVKCHQFKWNADAAANSSLVAAREQGDGDTSEQLPTDKIGTLCAEIPAKVSVATHATVTQGSRMM